MTDESMSTWDLPPEHEQSAHMQMVLAENDADLAIERSLLSIAEAKEAIETGDTSAAYEHLCFAIDSGVAGLALWREYQTRVEHGA